MKRVVFTQSGLEEKKKEYQDLLRARPAYVKDLAKAREMGDLSENGYYKSARMKLSDTDRRIRQLKYLLKTAVVHERKNSDVVEVGSRVTVMVNNTKRVFDIVGTYEANPSQGKISSSSPLGSLLLGKKINDTVELRREDSVTSYTILSIE